MKKLLCVLMSVLMVLSLAACGGQEEAFVPDYASAEEFEEALNNGEALTGKTVTITVDAFVPDSAFGYNVQTGEHLNFCSAEHPGVSEGDTLTVKATAIESMLGSYLISYEIVK